MSSKDFHVKALLIYGAGVSGTGAARLALAKGFQVHLWDDNEDVVIPSDIQNHPLCAVNERDIDFENLCFMPSPGIPETTSTYKHLLQNCESSISEIDFSLFYLHRPVIAVTGTNGKSTFAAMLNHLTEAYEIPAPMVGNFGVPLSEACLRKNKAMWYILELSSYQLAQSYKIAPLASVITNIAQDHLLRHKTFQDYVKVKWRVVSWLGKEQGKYPPPLMTTKAVCDLAQNMGLYTKSHRIFTAEEATAKKSFEKLACIGFKQSCLQYLMHLKGGVEASSIAEYQATSVSTLQQIASDVSIEEMQEELKAFPGLPHRQQKMDFSDIRIQGNIADDSKGQSRTWRAAFSGEHIQWTIVDDSKATNMGAVIYGLKEMLQEHRESINIALILGGRAKLSEDFSLLKPYLCKLQAIFVFGEAQKAIISCLGKEKIYAVADSLQELMCQQGQLSKWWKKHPKTWLVLSPGCESFDEFLNFSQRGKAFQAYAKDIIGLQKASSFFGA